MANEDSLLSVIDVLLKVLISFNLLKLLSALATVTGQVSKIRSAMYTFGYNSNTVNESLEDSSESLEPF